MSSLAEAAKQTLLDVARRAVRLAAERGELLADLPSDEVLQRPTGAFVTLHRFGRLRGCVGQLASNEPLISVVAYCAMAAALEDPRFTPMNAAELDGIEIEISVLSSLAEISPDQIEAGKHGLLVSNRGNRGVLLPQVALEHQWEARRFLEETCVKAGLEREAWRDAQTRIQAFTAEIFSEANSGARPNSTASSKSKPGYSTST
jgi:uncharacterized protein